VACTDCRGNGSGEAAASGEKPIESADSWFAAKAIVVAAPVSCQQSVERSSQQSRAGLKESHGWLEQASAKRL